MAGGYVDVASRKRLLEIRDVILREFTYQNWLDVGTVTGSLDLIQSHKRLLRSLGFGDTDYGEHILPVLVAIVGRERENLDFLESYMSEKFAFDGVSISTTPSKNRRIVFSPSVFEVPEGGVEQDLVAVMMPFSAEFEPVFTAIKAASDKCLARCLRVKDIWENQTIIQDVFSLIFRANVVICDYSGRNPNVFYEAGIAHTLGKMVIPLSQSGGDVPFDVAHHRYLHYHNNGEGLRTLEEKLAERLIGLVL